MEALRRPWWIHFRDNENVRDTVRLAFAQVLVRNTRKAYAERSVAPKDVLEQLGWQRWHIARLLDPYHYEAGAPSLYLYLLSMAMGVSIHDLLPSERELFVAATRRLSAKYDPQGTVAADRVCIAYVEYHFQLPQIARRHPDPDTVATVHRELTSHFSSESDLKLALEDAGNMIERVFAGEAIWQSTRRN